MKRHTLHMRQVSQAIRANFACEITNFYKHGMRNGITLTVSFSELMLQKRIAKN